MLADGRFRHCHTAFMRSACRNRSETKSKLSCRPACPTPNATVGYTDMPSPQPKQKLIGKQPKVHQSMQLTMLARVDKTDSSRLAWPTAQANSQSKPPYQEHKAIWRLKAEILRHKKNFACFDLNINTAEKMYPQRPIVTTIIPTKISPCGFNAKRSSQPAAFESSLW